MPNHLNEVHLIGVIYSPKTKAAGGEGNVMTSFQVETVTDGYTTRNRVVAWGSLAQEAEISCREGDWVEVRGEMRTRSYKDHGGQWKYITEVVASGIKVLEGAGQEQEIPAESGAGKDRIQPDSSAPPPAEDGLPF